MKNLPNINPAKALKASLHPFDLLVGAVAAVLLRLVVWSKIKNAKKYRHGEEYGTARWSA